MKATGWIAVICVVVLVGAFIAVSRLFAMHERSPVVPDDSATGSATSTPLAGTSTPAVTGNASSTSATSAPVGLAALSTSTPDTSSWLAYTDDPYGYRLSYPDDLIINDNGSVVTLAFPKNSYFHWPLLDDAKATITVAATCAALQGGGGPGSSSPATTTVDGMPFLYSQGGDVAAGGVYLEFAFDTTENGSCYHLDLLDHGANGAGLYVNDQSLASSYDAQHARDLSAVKAVFAGIVSSFRLTSLSVTK